MGPLLAFWGFSLSEVRMGGIGVGQAAEVVVEAVATGDEASMPDTHGEFTPEAPEDEGGTDAEGGGLEAWGARGRGGTGVLRPGPSRARGAGARWGASEASEGGIPQDEAKDIEAPAAESTGGHEKPAAEVPRGGGAG